MADHSKDELACVYAALVLLDDDVAITVCLQISSVCTSVTGKFDACYFFTDFSSFEFVIYCTSCHKFVFQAEKIQTILKAADVKVEPYWPGLFAKALEGLNLKSMITNVGSGVGAAPAAGGAPAAGKCNFNFQPHTLITMMITGWFAKLLNDYI